MDLTHCMSQASRCCNLVPSQLYQACVKGQHGALPFTGHRLCTVQQGAVPLTASACNTGPAWRTLVVFKAPLVRRSDAVPRLSYSSVEGIFVELVNASPVRKAMQDVGRK